MLLSNLSAVGGTCLFNVSSSLFVALLTLLPSGTALVLHRKRRLQPQPALTSFALKANPPRNQRERNGSYSPTGNLIAKTGATDLTRTQMYHNTDYFQSRNDPKIRATPKSQRNCYLSCQPPSTNGEHLFQEAKGLLDTV